MAQTLPQISINGTKASVLCEEAHAVYLAASVLLRTMRANHPNARDYQHRPDAYGIARAEFVANCDNVIAVARYYQDLAEWLADQT